MTKNELRGYIFKHMEEQGLNYTSVGKMMKLTRSAVQSAMTNDSVTYDKLFSICEHIGLAVEIRTYAKESNKCKV